MSNSSLTIPLLFSILLFVSSKLKPLKPTFSKTISRLISFQKPVLKTKLLVNQKKDFLFSLPNVYYQNLSLQSENNRLKSQNILLFNQLKISQQSKTPWATVPIRIIKTEQIITATSDRLDQISAGMPYIQDSSLLGVVQKISPPIIYILPLTNKDISFPVQTASGIQGDYLYQKHTPQMINLADQTFPTADETVFTLPSEQIPEGLVIGQIAQRLSKPSSPSQKVAIKLISAPISSTGLIIISPHTP